MGVPARILEARGRLYFLGLYAEPVFKFVGKHRMASKPSDWSLSTKWLHLGISACVTFQLASNLYMKPTWKKHGSDHVRHLLFHAHMWVGMAVTFLVLLLWWQIFKGLQAFVWVRGYWACIRRPRRQVWYPYA